MQATVTDSIPVIGASFSDLTYLNLECRMILDIQIYQIRQESCLFPTSENPPPLFM